ncbi:hypothetical protein AWT69_002762 [Pseudomonas putida]|nr:hypothetical protein AWT69_002762 [Pseudomonas putida]
MDISGHDVFLFLIFIGMKRRRPIVGQACSHEGYVVLRGSGLAPRWGACNGAA